jgi:hypothetical protein
LYFSFFSASFCMTFLFLGISASIIKHFFSFFNYYISLYSINDLLLLSSLLLFKKGDNTKTERSVRTYGSHRISQKWVEWYEQYSHRDYATGQTRAYHNRFRKRGTKN